MLGVLSVVACVWAVSAAGADSAPSAASWVTFDCLSDTWCSSHTSMLSMGSFPSAGTSFSTTCCFSSHSSIESTGIFAASLGFSSPFVGLLRFACASIQASKVSEIAFLLGDLRTFLLLFGETCFLFDMEERFFAGFLLETLGMLIESHSCHRNTLSRPPSICRFV